MPKILEQEALFLAQNIDGLEGEKKASALDILTRYKQQQEDEGLPDFPTQESERRNRELEFREMFKSPEAIKYEPAQFSANPILDKQQHANMALLARAYQKEPLEIAERYDFFLNDYATQRFSKKEIDTAGFYAEARKMIERDEKRENAFLEGSRAALRGENVISSLQGWQAKNLDMMEDSSQFTQGFLRAQEKAGDMIPLADKMLKLMESGTSKSNSTRVFDADAAKELDDMTAELATMKPRERKEVYASIAARVEAAGYDQKGFWSQMLGQIDQGLFRMSQTVPQGMGSVLGTIGEFVGGEDTVYDREFRDRLAKERGEETTAEMKLRQEKLGEVQSEVAQIISGTVDPVKTTVGWIPDYLEAGAIKGPGAVLPFMTASAALGPYGARLVFTADFAEQNRRDLVASGLDRDDAARIGMMEAPLQAAVESLSNAFQLGKWASPIAPGSSFLKRYVTNSIASGATEFTEEQVQENIIRPIVQNVVGMIDANVPQIGFGEMWDKMKSDTPELISVLAPMALVFGGVMTNADLQLSRDLTGNVDGMTALGYSQAQATTVIQEKDEAGRIAKARELWGVRAGTKESMQAGAAKLSEKMRLFQADASLAQAELERRGKIPRMLPTQEGSYRLTMNDGSTAEFPTYQEASAARWAWFRDQLGKESVLLRQSLEGLEKNLERGRELAIEFKPETMTASEAKQRGIISEPQLQERLEQAAVLDESVMMGDAVTLGKIEGNQEEVAILLGMSKNQWFDQQGRELAIGNFKNDVLRTTVKLWEGAGLFTLVEEKTEGDAKTLISSGKRDWMLERLRSYEKASGDKLFRFEDDEKLNSKDIIEAWSHVAQAYLITGKEGVKGRSYRRYLRNVEESGLTAVMNAQATEWQSVVNRAQKLMEAKKAGILPADFTEELERQLGIDSQVKHDAGALQELASIIDTSGYSEETPGPNGETFSIRAPTDSEIEAILPGATYIEPGDLMFADISGPVIVGVYHGTTHEINRFTDERANLENDLGAGIYATNEVQDVNENYAREGPDLTNRIEQMAESIFQDRKHQPNYGTAMYDAAMDKARAKARKALVGHGGAVLPLLVPMKNPVVLEDGGGTFITLTVDAEEYREEAEIRVMQNNGIERDELEDYSGEVDDMMQEVAAENGAESPLQRILDVVSEFGETDSSELSGALYEASINGMRAADLENELRKNEGTVYATYGDNSDMALGELIRRVFMDALGFDGIIDRNVNRKFGSRGRGKAMAGMDDSTVHVIVATDAELRPRSAINPSGETFSLRSGDFEARAAAMFSPFQRTPELRMAIARVAKERAMRLGAEWIEKAAVLRTSASISKEQAFREADSFDRRVNDYLESLTPSARQELEFEPASLENDPLVAAMLDEGKLMSRNTAVKNGVKNLDEYDGVPWLPPAWYSKGAGIMPDQMAQAMNDAGLLPDAYTGTLWDALASRIESTRKNKAAHREAVQAYQDAKKQAKADAKAEAEAWATQAKKEAGSPKAQREMLKAALRTLDGILSAAPPEVRARVGGYVKLAGLATDEAMLQEIERRVAKLNVELEKWLTKQAREQLTRIFKKAKPKAEAGEKAKGKLTPEVHAWFALAEEVSTLSPAAADERIEGIANSLSQEMTPAIKEELSRWLGRTVSDDAEAQDWQEQRMTILQTFGSVLYGTDAKPARGAGDTTAAFDLAKEVYTDGRLAHIEETAKKRERREADRGDGISRLGGPYDPEKATQRKKALNKLTGLKGRAADYLDTGLDASGFFLDLLGDGNLYENTRRNILEADMAKDDAMRKRKAEFATMLTEVFPKKGLTDRLRGLWELQQIQTDSPVGTLSQLQAMQFTLWWQDMDSREWLEGNGYGEEWQAKAEAWLTSEARGLRSWLMKQYAGQYDRINPVFRRLRGVNLPRVDVYGGKRQVEHSKADSSVALETDMMRGGMEAGFTKTRVSRPTGPPKITDALQNYWQNAHQVEHYIAFAETVTELKAVFGHRDFRLAVETNRGQDKAKQVSDWIANIEQAGSRDAFAHSAQGLLFGRYGKAVSASALLFKLSVLAKQAPAAIQSAFKVGLKEYFASLARVMSGKAAISLGDMYQSDTVQRRLSQHDAEMQQASKGWNQRHFENEIIDKVATTPDLLMNAGWYAIGWTDARFTTVSAAVAYDVAYRDARRLGSSEEEAKAFAADEAALIVMETAQPQSVVTKSLFENQTPMALLRFLFAFQGANRQVFGLTYLALKKGGVANAWGTAALIAGMAQTVGGLIRMMTTDDEPEELFKPEAYALGMATAPLTGMMGLGLIVEAIGNGVGVESRISASPVTMLASAIKDIAEGDADVKDVSRSMSILGTVLGGRGAALGVGWNVLNQLFGLYENITKE